MTEEGIIEALFYNDNGQWVFKYADPRIVLGKDSFIDTLPRVVQDLVNSR